MMQWYTADEREPIQQTNFCCTLTLLQRLPLKVECVDDTEETVNNVVPPRVITEETAVEYGEGFLLWLETKEVDYIDIVRLSNLVKFAKKVRDDRKKQKKIVDFLKIKLSNWHRVYYLARLN